MTQETHEEIPFYKNWHDLIEPERPDVNKQTRSDRYAKIVSQPFERGFATTIGNSLRRILLSSIRGAAITSVKVENHDNPLPGTKIFQPFKILFMNNQPAFKIRERPMSGNLPFGFRIGKSYRFHRNIHTV